MLCYEITLPLTYVTHGKWRGPGWTAVRMHTGPRSFTTGNWDVHSCRWPRGEENHQQPVLGSSALPLSFATPPSQPTRVKSVHGTGHVFRGSSKACWHEVPFKACPGSLCGLRSIGTSPFPGKSWTHPTTFLFLFTQGSRHKQSEGCPAAPPRRQHHRQEKPHTHTSATRWDLVIRS